MLPAHARQASKHLGHSGLYVASACAAGRHLRSQGSPATAVFDLSMESSDSDEPLTPAEEAMRHPLWMACSEACSSHPHATQAVLLSGGHLRLNAGCMILVTTAGRMIFQKNRCGYQGFGGGNHCMPLVFRVHTVRREAFMESNFDVYNPALISMTRPLLVSQDGFTSCVVQVAVLDDQQVRVHVDGTLWVAGVQLWSREQAYVHEEATPTAQNVQSGAFYYGDPIMRVLTADFVWDNPHEFRMCDWVTLSMIRRTLEDMVAWWAPHPRHILDAPPYLSKFFCFGDTPGWYRGECDRLANLMNTVPELHMFQTRWPLLPESVLYATWGRQQWRFDNRPPACEVDGDEVAST